MFLKLVKIFKVVGFFLGQINISRTKREAEVIWTRKKASDFCNNFIKQSQTYKACSRVPGVSPDSLIENCVLDIMVCLLSRKNLCLVLKWFKKLSQRN